MLKVAPQDCSGTFVEDKTGRGFQIDAISLFGSAWIPKILIGEFLSQPQYIAKFNDQLSIALEQSMSVKTNDNINVFHDDG